MLSVTEPLDALCPQHRTDISPRLDISNAFRLEGGFGGSPKIWALWEGDEHLQNHTHTMRGALQPFRLLYVTSPLFHAVCLVGFAL